MAEQLFDRPALNSVARWACVAFAARCARRVVPVLRQAGLEGTEAALKVLDIVESAAAEARAYTDREVFLLTDAIDDIELEYRCRPRDNGLGKPSETESRRTSYRAGSLVLLAAKHAAFGLVRSSDKARDNTWICYRNASSAACHGQGDDPDEAITNSEIACDQMREDFERIRQMSADNGWCADSPVGRDIFGPMWPTVTPTWAMGRSRWDEIK